MRLWWREQERNQVRHLLDRDAGFNAFGQQRKAGAEKLRDGAAEDRFGHALGALEREARGAFVGDDPFERQLRQVFALRMSSLPFRSRCFWHQCFHLQACCFPGPPNRTGSTGWSSTRTLA